MMSSQPLKRWIGIGAVFLLLIVSFLLLDQAMDRFNESAYPLAYEETVNSAAEEYNIPPSLIYAVIHTESHFRPSVSSHAGAIGLMQITDDTYRWALQRANAKDTYDPDALLDPATNIRIGTYILRLLQQDFTETETVLAAYNAGQGKVHQWLKDPACSSDGITLQHIPYTETADYIDRVLSAQNRYQMIYNIP